VPPATTDVDGALSVTDVRTGIAVTVIDVDPETVVEPDVAVAVIVVTPAASAVTRPDWLTVATEATDDVQVTLAANVFPLWSRGVAET